MGEKWDVWVATELQPDTIDLHVAAAPGDIGPDPMPVNWAAQREPDPPGSSRGEASGVGAGRIGDWRHS